MYNLLIKIFILLVKIIASSWQIKTKGDIPSNPSIVVFWHGYMMPVWKYFAKKNALALVSKSKDGEILSNLLEKWKIKLIRGSSKKEGKQALENLISIANQHIVLITPDGPQGPAQEMKAGAFVAAARTELALYLCCVSIKSAFIFNKSWDNFRFPLPFTKITLNFSEKILINPNSNREEIDNIIQNSENKLNSMMAN